MENKDGDLDTKLRGRRDTWLVRSGFFIEPNLDSSLNQKKEAGNIQPLFS
jgi:hypothetical protein